MEMVVYFIRLLLIILGIYKQYIIKFYFFIFDFSYTFIFIFSHLFSILSFLYIQKTQTKIYKKG